MDEFRPVLYKYKDECSRFYWYPCLKYKLGHHYGSGCDSKDQINKCYTGNSVDWICNCYNFHEKTAKLVISDRNLALLNLYHNESGIRKLCEMKLRYREIEVKYV